MRPIRRAAIPLVLWMALETQTMAQEATVVTVGRDSGDVKGADSLALQAAADRLAQQAPAGGGTLLIKAGAYTMHDSLHVRVPMTVRGEGDRTVLKKAPQVTTTLTETFDIGEYTAQVADAAGLRVGMGVSFKDRENAGGWAVSVRTIVAIDGRSIRLDRRPERDYSADAVVQNAFPIIDVRHVDGVVIEDLAVDGNLAENRGVAVDGCRAAGIYLNVAGKCTVRRCLVRDYNGDGFSWQTTEDITVEDCRSLGNASKGFHPGTTSLRTVMRNCIARRNGDAGLFVCWGVRYGRFEKNVLEDNGRYGVSIGHKDTDNLFLRNQIRRNGGAGFYFRNDSRSLAAHRCTLFENVIEDNGQPGKPGIGVFIDGETDDTVLEANVIRDTRAGKERTQLTAVKVGPHAGAVTIAPSNTIQGPVQRP
jgi:hypothetical protein